ncbi:acyl-CoA dehydrogenase family protein [Wenjunlia tyrosinilytica]|uniref:Acyl-CoA dehydrogenase n=1 Tax=Wenjunlia tyrosinilytica TaxID=1544741 RepID=A0A917ZP20_9ACTN|nr:acyl-CoA dehydrogenase family protein [Wenjunlia tyrosinilytica]GGO86834.1 hypothetical protein GCM10012280_23900 [Wenjunlia tyrosinilytica]
MDFRLTEEQQALRAGARELLAGRFGRERLRAAVEAKDLDRGLWAELAGAGMFSMRLAEPEGGAGLGLPEAVLVFEEAGRALLPGPLVATHLAAGLLDEAVVAVVDTTRRPLLAEHLADAQAVLVLDGKRVRRADPAAFDPVPEPCLDPLTPLYRVRGGPHTMESLAVLDTDVRTLRRQGALLTAALQLGIALRTLESAVAHAREREQFGRPIGSFQAVKHLCADMLGRAEVARVAVYAASVTGDAVDTATAKLLADEAAVRNARDCLQVHGGTGFTWEADVHLFLKRAWVHATQYADAAANEETLAAALRR